MRLYRKSYCTTYGSGVGVGSGTSICKMFKFDVKVLFLFCVGQETVGKLSLTWTVLVILNSSIGICIFL